MLGMLGDKKKVASVILSGIKKPEEKEHSSEIKEELTGLVSAMDKLLAAIESKSSKAMAEAFKEACEIVDAAPHEEGEHVGEEPESTSF